MVTASPLLPLLSVALPLLVVLLVLMAVAIVTVSVVSMAFPMGHDDSWVILRLWVR